MVRFELELRNLPRFRIMEYLAEAGGVENGELSVVGDGWSAWLEEMVPAQVGRLSVRRDMLIIEGEDEEAVKRVNGHMRLRTMRGGG